ncbi:MAG TPA: glycerophosphodiester phosphodiesterase family protein [Roseovarius sp.]|nr:glycerophosphodiester phosphodiesterase family protein [Roseovarius sp.]
MTALHPDFCRLPLAHRGLHDVKDGRPENSRASIRAAIAAGYGIEIDLQLSSDGQAMVFHDYDLGRLTGQKGAIRQRAAQELAQIALLGGAEGVPGFDEVLDLVAGQVPLLVELKDQHGQMGQTDGQLEGAVASALDGYDGPLAVMSFNPHSVALLRDLAPDVPRGLTTCSYRRIDWMMLKREVRHRLREIPDYDAVDACFVSHQVKALDAPCISALKGRGAAVLCWTVRSAAQEAQARRIADNITFEGYLPEIRP